MYYDMQSDRLYDNEYAMEGIFGKLKEKNSKLKAINTNIKAENGKMAKEEIYKAVDVVKSFIVKAKKNPKWKHLPLQEYYNDDSDTGICLIVFYIYDNDYIMYPRDEDYEPDAEACFKYILDNSKREIEKMNTHIKIENVERVDITLSLRY